MKKRWEKPSMQVIVRSKPEEAVLGACKYVSFTPNTPTAQDSTCRKENCQSCQGETIS